MSCCCCCCFFFFFFLNFECCVVILIAHNVLLQRATSLLPRAMQIDVVSKFARLEFEIGSGACFLGIKSILLILLLLFFFVFFFFAVERGRTLFEGVIANHPKRLDQWLIYADMECKHAEPPTARRIYERVTTLKLAAKQMRAVLKRWLAFEQAHGTPTTVQAVKQRARDYVAALNTTATIDDDKDNVDE